MRWKDRFNKIKNNSIVNKIIDFIFRKYPGQLVIVLVLLMAVNVNFKYKLWNWENKVISWDIISYYAYLPATFIYNDISLEFAEENPEKFGDKIWYFKSQTGKNTIITSMGLAFLYMPFFLIAHLFAPWLGFEASGYTAPYSFALIFSCLAYLIVGLHFLRKLLERYFSKQVTAVVLFSVVIGTNLYYYVTIEAAMSHGFNFSLISVLLYLTDSWYRDKKYATAAWLGLVFGLIVLIRPTNIIVVLLLFFWGITSFKGLGDRILFYLKAWPKLLVMIFFFFLVWVPQFAYWKYVSGSFLYYTYGEYDASFFFNNPQILKSLFSYRKGWLIYTPIMALGLIGLISLFRQRRELFWPVTIYALVLIYVLSSWWCWWFGGGYGLRSYIDGYAALAIPLAAFITFFMKRKIIYRIVVLVVIGFLIWLNTFQMRQYLTGAIHWMSMTKEAYWETFLKEYPTDEYKEALRYPDYPAAKKGIYRSTDPDTTNPWTGERIYPEPDSVKVREIEESIRNNPALLEDIREKAEERNISLDSMIKLDAIWILRNKK
mgnify:CR=1 FL=1